MTSKLLQVLMMSVNSRLSADDSWQWFAWAGLMLQVPASFRMGTIDGNARRGRLRLLQEDQLRLQLSWTTPKPRRFDPTRHLQQKLLRTLPKKMRKAESEIVCRVVSSTFTPLMGYCSEQEGIDRYLGYCPTTGRAVELVYHHRSVREDKRFRSHMLKSLTDQPADKPQQWGFFNHRFKTPANYAYQRAILNIGDMQIDLNAINRTFTRAKLSIRFIYPAALALQRQSIPQWLAATIHTDKNMRRPRYLKRFRRGGPVHESVDTPLGPALRCITHLRWMFRLVSWTVSWKKCAWLIHDQQQDRLIIITIDDRSGRFEPLLSQVLQGLHQIGP